MSLEQYWDGDTDLPKYFREKHKLERDRKNFESWLQGKYIYDALCAVAPIVRAFSKATEPLPYRERPLPLTEAELDAEIERREQEQMQKNIDAMLDMTKEWNKQRKGESEVGRS